MSMISWAACMFAGRVCYCRSAQQQSTAPLPKSGVSTTFLLASKAAALYSSCPVPRWTGQGAYRAAERGRENNYCIITEDICKLPS